MDYQKHLKILKETLELHKITPENLRENRMPFKEFPKQINNRVVYVFQSFAPFDRAPVWMRRQVGRYLPECREIKAEMGFFDLSKSFYCCRNHFITNKTI